MPTIGSRRMKEVMINEKYCKKFQTYSKAVDSAIALMLKRIHPLQARYAL